MMCKVINVNKVLYKHIDHHQFSFQKSMKFLFKSVKEGQVDGLAPPTHGSPCIKWTRPIQATRLKKLIHPAGSNPLYHPYHFTSS